MDKEDYTSVYMQGYYAGKDKAFEQTKQTHQECRKLLDENKQLKDIIDKVNEEIFKYLVSEDYCSAKYKDLPNFLLKINRIIGVKYE